MKNLLLFSVSIVLVSCSLFKKKEPKPEPVDINKIYTLVEKMPEFPGGEEALFTYLSNTIKSPKLSKNKEFKERFM